jgi:hypothetical protein
MAEVAAGWYADPNGGSGQRYWDGTDWTQSTTATDAQAVPQPSGQSQSRRESSPGEGKLSQAERTQILDVALMSRAPRSVGIIGGRIRNTGPRIRRSATSAEVSWAMPVTHPGRFCWELILSFLTCGIYLPFWFIATLGRPKVDTVTIDEYGNQQWRQATTSSAQRVISVVVGALVLLWIYLVFHVYEVWQTGINQQRCNSGIGVCNP